MQLDTKTINYIKNVVKTAQLVGIENIIIERGKVRAIDEHKTVVMFHDTDVPNFDFESIGLTRISIFLSRLSLVDGGDNFKVEVVTKEGTNQVISLAMKANGIKVDYRCANTATIIAPKGKNDVLKYRIMLNPESVLLLQKAQAAMPQASSHEVVTISSNVQGVFFELSDVTNDVFSLKVGSTVQCLVDDNSSLIFTHRYPIKTLLALFKQNPEGFFDIGQKGMLNMVVNDLNVYVIPQIA